MWFVVLAESDVGEEKILGTRSHRKRTSVLIEAGNSILVSALQIWQSSALKLYCGAIGSFETYIVICQKARTEFKIIIQVKRSASLESQSES